MLFNSITFAIFLPIVFCLYWFVFNKNLKLQNLFIVVVSYIFYGWWSWKFLLLMGFTTLCSYLSGVLINKAKTHKGAKLISIGNIVLNLGILGVYKYYNFFVSNLIDAFSSMGLNIDNGHTLHLILPVGISFYTFQALSYSIDVYKKKLEPTHDIVAFFAYVSFFPQLVAGPIERSTHLLPQIIKKRKFDYEMAADGARQILWGLFKKVVVADGCAKYVNLVYGDYLNQSGSTLLLSAILFSFQIYCDFSGYSDIAIGTARLFGINLMQNFNFPYFSRDIAEFWRRWHISLTTWFRDYLYIPLGGSRVGKSKAVRNTFIIFIVSGFWHGANWTFLAWGFLHALLFLPLILMNKNRKNTDVVAKNRILPTLKELFQIGITFLITTFAWILFRSNNIKDAIHYIFGIFKKSLFTIPTIPYVIISVIIILIVIEWVNRGKQHGLEISDRSPFIRRLVYTFLVIIIYVFRADSVSFIYFQF